MSVGPDVLDEARTEASRLIARLRLADEGSAISYLSGSRVAGFGNERSDFDLFIVVDDPPESSTLIISGNEHSYFDTELHLRAEMSTLAGRVNGVPLDDPDQVGELDGDALDLYYRAAIGLPLTGDPAAFAAFQAQFSEARLAAVAAAHHALTLAGAREEARRARSRGEFRLALAARRVFECGVDAYLAANGEGFPQPKWRFEKLGRILPPSDELHRRIWGLKSCGDRRADEYLTAVEELLRDLDIPRLDPVPREGPDLWKRVEGVELFSISPFRMLFESLELAYEIDDAAEAVWLALPEPGASSLSAEGVAAGCRGLPLETVRVILRELGELGLVEQCE